MRSRLWFAGPILFSIAAIAACEDDSVHADPLPVTLSISPWDDAELYLGETLPFSLVLVNSGDKDITFQFEDSCLVGYEIVKGGDVLVRYPAACAPPSQEVTFRNLGQYSFDLQLSTYDELSNVEWNVADDHLPTGTYVLRAGLLEHGSAVRWAQLDFVVSDAP